jgi:endonuclease YncB( thermonuclease family)
MFFIFLLLPLYSCAQLTGKVVAIADGDSFTMLVDNKQVKIRLHGIDCPEKGQDYYQVAKQYLSDLIFNKTVVAQKTKTDKYRRTIAIVTVGGVNVNEKLLEKGLAWHYREFDNNPTWQRLEDNARNKKVGLWQEPNPIPPWEYRKKKRRA